MTSIAIDGDTIVKTISLWLGYNEASFLTTLDHPNIIKSLGAEVYIPDGPVPGGATHQIKIREPRYTPIEPKIIEDETLAKAENVKYPGYTLAKRLDYGISEDLRAIIYRDILAALYYLQINKIHHNDVKPENIVIDKANSRALLIDFGISTRSSTYKEFLVCTPTTEPPEFRFSSDLQHYQRDMRYNPQREYDPRTLPVIDITDDNRADFFSLASSLIILRTGRFYPVWGTSYEQWANVRVLNRKFVLERGYEELLVGDPLADQLRPWLEYDPRNRPLFPPSPPTVILTPVQNPMSNEESQRIWDECFIFVERFNSPDILINTYDIFTAYLAKKGDLEDSKWFSHIAMSHYVSWSLLDPSGDRLPGLQDYVSMLDESEPEKSSALILTNIIADIVSTLEFKLAYNLPA